MEQNTVLPQPELKEKLPKWPWLPWAVLVALISWILFGTTSHATPLVIQEDPISRVADANYGTFSKLDFQPPGNKLLAYRKMSDDRISLLYHDTRKELMVSVIFDPITSTFIKRSSNKFEIPIGLEQPKDDDKLEEIETYISQAIIINDNKAVVIFGNAIEFKISQSDALWVIGRIIDLDTGITTDLTTNNHIFFPFLSSEPAIRQLMLKLNKIFRNDKPTILAYKDALVLDDNDSLSIIKLNDQEFAVYGLTQHKILYDKNLEIGGNERVITLKTFDLTGKEVKSKDFIGNQSFAIPIISGGDPSVEARWFNSNINIYDRGEDVYILRSPQQYSSKNSNLTLFNKKNLTFTQVANNIYADSLTPLPNGLLLASVENPINTFSWRVGDNSLKNKIYLIDPESFQSTPLILANALPIQEQLLTGLTEWTGEGYRKAIDPLKLQYRTSVLSDGTILLAANNLAEIAVYYWLIDLNGYKMLQPINQTTRERLSSFNRDNWIGFDADITLADGRVLYLGKTTVLYTPASEQTPAQAEIISNKNNLPNWPGTNFKGEGVWNKVGQSKIVLDNQANTFPDDSDGDSDFQPPPTLLGIFTDHNDAEFFWGPRNIGNTISAIVESWRYGDKITSNLRNDKTTPGDGVKDEFPIHDKYKKMQYEQKQERYIAKVGNKTYRLGLPQTGIPVCDAIPPTQGNCPDTNPSTKIEKHDTSTKKWVEVKDGKLNLMRKGHSVTTLLDDKIAIVGGTSSITDQSARHYYRGLRMSQEDLKEFNLIFGLTKSIEVYDPKTNKSEEIGKLKIGRIGHQTIILPDNKVIVIGGSEQQIVTKDHKPITHTSSTYEIIDLKTGESKLYENILMFRHDTNDFETFVMPNGFIYIGDSGVESGAEILDWKNGISYPTGQPELRNLGQAWYTQRLENGKLVSTGADVDEVKAENNSIIHFLQDPSTISVYTPVSSGRQLPIAQPPSRDQATSYAWQWLSYVQLSQLLIGFPLSYILAAYNRKRKLIIPL